MDSVTVQVPGSTSNLGPGLDCLGVALAIHNRVTIARGGTPRPHPMVADSAARFFAAAGLPAFAFTWEITGDVPISRGLGSSVTLRHGILAGLNELAGRPLDTEKLFRLCTAGEGHPDNAGPAAFGGFFVGSADGTWIRFDVSPELKFVLLVPEIEILTDDARRVLPASVNLRDAIGNLGRTAVLTAAFASRQYEKLRGSFDDHLHQPQRAQLLPGLFDIIAGGTAAGALGGFLSGSGSTIACVSWQSDPGAIARAMIAAWPGREPVRSLIVPVDPSGAMVVAQS